MENLVVVNHPLVQSKLAILRSRETSPQAFRDLISEITMILLSEATKDLTTRRIEVDTPLKTAKCLILNRKIAIVPILRAGLGMLEGALKLIPQATVGYIGIYRKEADLIPVIYYKNLPQDLKNTEVIIVDPMIATGGSAVEAIKYMFEAGADKVKFVCIIAAPEGIERINQQKKNVKIYTAALDEGLNDKGYIVPGLGDAGDRLFGTE
ncbi:MAG: uracil phosphoribosyltransferase [Fidelibacterota bacterium]